MSFTLCCVFVTEMSTNYHKHNKQTYCSLHAKLTD
jgi:hypothetical protein